MIKNINVILFLIILLQTQDIKANDSLDWINKINYKKFKSAGEVKKLDFGHACFREDIDPRYKLIKSDLNYIADFYNLEDLNISENNIESDAMKNIYKLKKLKKLNIAGTKIDDRGLEYISMNKSLEEINFSYTGCTNAGIKYLSENINLKKIVCNGYLPEDAFLKINDDTLEIFASFKKLAELQLKMVFTITDKGMMNLSKSGSLEYIDISYTGITDKSIDFIAGMKGLKKIIIEGTDITLEGFKKLKNLRRNIKIIY